MVEFRDTFSGKRYIVSNKYNQILLITSDRLFAEKVNQVMIKIKDQKKFKIGIWDGNKYT